MRLRRKSPGFVSSATPGIALGVLIGLPVIMPNHLRLDPAAMARQEAVTAAVEGAPYQVGRWLAQISKSRAPRSSCSNRTRF